MVAVAPMYDREPNTPAVYNAARERIAGLKKNSGLSVAAWHALKPYANGMRMGKLIHEANGGDIPARRCASI